MCEQPVHNGEQQALLFTVGALLRLCDRQQVFLEELFVLFGKLWPEVIWGHRLAVGGIGDVCDLLYIPDHVNMVRCCVAP